MLFRSDLEASVTAAKHRFLINSSSGIIFADDPRAEAEKLDREIREVLAQLASNVRGRIVSAVEDFGRSGNVMNVVPFESDPAATSRLIDGEGAE